MRYIQLLLIVLAFASAAEANRPRDARTRESRTENTGNTSRSFTKEELEQLASKFKEAALKESTISPNKDIMREYLESIKQIQDPEMQTFAKRLAEYLLPYAKSGNSEGLQLVVKLMDLASTPDAIEGGINNATLKQMLRDTCTAIFETKDVDAGVERAIPDANQRKAIRGCKKA